MSSENKKTAKVRISQKSKEYADMAYDRINKTKPWLKSTGPKTKDGKEKSCQNSITKGDTAIHSIYMKQLINQVSIITAAALKEERKKYESALSTPSDPDLDPT